MRRDVTLGGMKEAIPANSGVLRVTLARCPEFVSGRIVVMGVHVFPGVKTKSSKHEKGGPPSGASGSEEP